MLSRKNKRTLKSPIINRVIELNNYLINQGQHAYKIIQRNYIDDLLKQGNKLFKYARRQLLGQRYAKRTMSLCEEIEAQAYFIAVLGGGSIDIAGNVNIMTEDIVKRVKYHSQHHKPIR